MSKKSRIFQVVLGVVMLALVVVTPMSGIADATIFPMTEIGDNLEWEVTDDYVLKITGEGPTYDGQGAIPPWFELLFNTIEIGEGVTEIGEYIYFGDWVKRMTLPSTLKTIKKGGICGVLMSSIQVPASVDTIKRYAFSDNEELTSVIILNPETHFETNVFDRSPVTIYALANSTAEDYAKENGIPFVAIDEYVNGANKCGEAVLWKVEDGVLKIYGYGDMYDYVKVAYSSPAESKAPWHEEKFSAIEICEGVTSIGDWAFCRSNGSANVKSISIADTVVEIGDHAFYQLGQTGEPQSLYIPESVVRIGESAFNGVDALFRVVIGGPAVVEKEAFENCRKVFDFVFYNEAPIVCDRFLASDPMLMQRIFGHPNTLVQAFAQENGIEYITFDDAEYPYFCGDTIIWDTYTFPEYRMTISGGGDMYDYERGTSPWYGENFKNLNFVGNINHIGNWAFYDCKTITKLALVDSIESIGASAFRNCEGIESIVLSENVSVIGEFAFSDCDALESVTIMNAEAEIGANAFAGSPATIFGIVGSTAQAYAEECGITFVPICECGSHNMTLTTIDATCTKDGYTEYVCSDCGNTYKNSVIERTGHDYVFSASYIDYDMYVCSKCSSKNYKYHEVENLDPDHELLRPRYDIGSNKNLSGNVHVVAFFLSDTDSTSNLDKWADKNDLVGAYVRVGKTNAKTMVQNGVNYITKTALKYDVSVNFSVEFVDVEADDALLDAADSRRNVIEYVAQTLEYNSATEMRAEYVENAKTDEIVFIILSPRLNRSYAMPDCWPNDGKEDEEYCVLFRQNYEVIPDRYHTANISAGAVAHELLHLYGALDLYDYDGGHSGRERLVRNIAYYELMLDVLNDSYLSSNKISEITAYGIGWIDDVPKQLYMPNFYYKYEDGYRNSFFFSRADVSVGKKTAINLYVHSAVLKDCDLSATKVIVKKPIYNTDGSIVDYVTTEISEFTEQRIGTTLYYVFSYDNISMTELSAEIEATISTVKVFTENNTTTRKSYIGAKANYSVKQYVEETLETSTDEEYKTLLVDLLNYGAARQMYSGYNTANLANAGLTAEQQAFATQEVPSVEYPYTTISKTSTFKPSIKHNGISLIVGDDFGFKIIFEHNGMNKNNLYAKVSYVDNNGETVEVIIDGNDFVRSSSKTFAFFVEGLDITQIRTVVNYTVYEKETDKQISYDRHISVGAFAYRSYNGAYIKPISKALFEALLKYSDSLTNYINN